MWSRCEICILFSITAQTRRPSQRPYVHMTFARRLYSVQDVLNARKNMLQRALGTHTGRPRCAYGAHLVRIQHAHSTHSVNASFFNASHFCEGTTNLFGPLGAICYSIQLFSKWMKSHGTSIVLPQRPHSAHAARPRCAIGASEEPQCYHSVSTERCANAKQQRCLIKFQNDSTHNVASDCTARTTRPTSTFDPAAAL